MPIITECYSFKNQIPEKKTKKSEKMILKEHYSFRREQ